MVRYLEQTSKLGDIKLRRIIEGSTLYWVPDPREYGKPGHYLPAELPVFYNPAMEVNRDLTILTVSAYSEIFERPLEDILYVEALAGTGIRGYRVANEVGEVMVLMNDIDPKCVRLMQYNMGFFPAELRSRLIILCNEACHLLSGLRYWFRPADIVDIDPFGSPSPFVDSAVRALKKKFGVLIVTATDTAPLIGKFRNSMLRKYGVWLFITPYGPELGVRSLIYLLGRTASKYGIGVRPLFGVFMRNFIKVAVLLIPGRRTADKFWRNIGWLCVDDEYCEAKVLEFSENRCNGRLIGPLWSGDIFDEEFLRVMLRKLRSSPLSDESKRYLEKWLSCELRGLGLRLYYDLEFIASKLGVSTPSTLKIIELLRSEGYIAERTHFCTKAVRTNASLKKVIEIVRSLGKSQTSSPNNAPRLEAQTAHRRSSITQG